MGKRRRKLTSAEKRARRERRRKYMTIFVNGKQKRVPRPQLIDGLSVDEFLARNADPIWLVQNELWEVLAEREARDTANAPYLKTREDVTVDWADEEDDEDDPLLSGLS